MNIFDALLEGTAKGKTIISCLDKEYTPQDLSVFWHGRHFASFRTGTMTKIEYKHGSPWRVKHNDRNE